MHTYIRVGTHHTEDLEAHLLLPLHLHKLLLQVSAVEVFPLFQGGFVTSVCQSPSQPHAALL